MNLVHKAAESSLGLFSQSFIDAYLTLITSHGADMTATSAAGYTPLHWAALFGSHCVAHWLCRQLTAEDVNRGQPNQPNRTPLAEAAYGLDDLIQREPHSRRIRSYKITIGVLLRAGAVPCIARMPTATQRQQHRHRQLVLAECTTVLGELSGAVMWAINAALSPQHDHSMLLARLLPLAPHHDGAHPYPSPSNMAFAPHMSIAWKIGAFLYEPSAAVVTIDEYLIGESPLRRRVRAAVGHFVESAATQTSSNREVVGGMASVGGVMVTVPPLQCFAVREGASVRRVGLREVVHRARMDEAARHGVEEGAINKGFNEHLGDQDCQFSWQQLGRIDRQTGLFVSLGIE
ncbi:unnamed protein product [Vitrella brassicaformis CCMP3155]|uniref:Uncharacterized protein n=1 Tax=Vitrella brassicaformis (strain CCMP3155) TaxID=1169540 RepID=A0A0G4ESS9_VITBC|nr:unnamed protein product [Vitrella brassicaformis CCMP3155]|eukprot:CEM01461.1 unnamed protein product [Vitrella brassicaformis CCMP3155]